MQKKFTLDAQNLFIYYELRSRLVTSPDRLKFESKLRGPNLIIEIQDKVH